jgi:uncharacterized protein (DUF302 family)
MASANTLASGADLIHVPYGNPSRPAHQKVITSRFDFESTLDRLKQAIANHDLWLIHEINPEMLAARGGYAIAPARQLLVFHPRYLERLLVADPAAVPEIPLKLIVMSMPDNKVTVRYNTATVLLGRYPSLNQLAAELDALLDAVVSEIYTSR